MAKFLSLGLSIVIFLIFLATLLQNALNAPSFDDYHTTLNFIRQFYFDHQPPGVQTEILLARHNEHRILFSKIVAGAYYSLFQNLNFRNLVLFQNLLLLAFVALMVFLLKSKKLLFPETILLISLFLFTLAFWQVTYYYWGGIQHYTVFFFSFLSLITLDRAKKLKSEAFLIAVLSVAFAVLSFGNGFLTLFLGGFILFVQKKWQLLIVWTIISCVLLAFTFLSKTPAPVASNVPFNLEWMARLLFTFLGSFLYVNPTQRQSYNIIICMLMGLLVMGTWIWLFFKGYAFKNPLFYNLLSMPILTGIIVAIARFESKAAGGIAPRYMFFTTVIPIMLVLIFLDMKVIKISHLRIITGLGGILWGVGFYNNYHTLRKTNAEIMQTLNKWEKDPNTPLIYYQEATEYSEILAWAVAHQVVVIPKEK